MKTKIPIFGKSDPYQGREDALQIAAIRTLRLKYNDSLNFHVPNGGYRSRKTAVGLKHQGTLAGVSDILILTPSERYALLVVELKVKGGRLQDSQKDFLNKCIKNGYAVAVCYSLDSFIEVIDKYFNNEKI